MLEKRRAAGLERVGVRLELLADRVALPLQRLAGARRQAEQLGDRRLDPGDQRVAAVEVAGLAGPERRDAEVVGDLRRPSLRVDSRDQCGALLGTQEIADDEQLELRAWNALDARPRLEPRGRAVFRAYRQARGSFRAG